MATELTPTRVLGAGDQRVVRDWLATLRGLLPGITVVGAAADGDEALDLPKDASAEEIQQAIAAVVRGDAAIDPAVQRHVVDAVVTGMPADQPTATPQLPDGLTAREA